MTNNAKQITGWILAGLVGLFLIGVSAIPKFFDWPGKQEMMSKLEIPLNLLPTLGVLEILVTLVFLIPRTSFVGAILLTGYLGGAVWTHLRMGDVWIFPIIIGVVVWISLALWRPQIAKLAWGNRCSQT